MKPFLAFLALEASSIRLRTSARLRSISACLAFFAYTRRELKHELLYLPIGGGGAEDRETL